MFDRKIKATISILQILNDFEPEEWEEILQEKIEPIRLGKLAIKNFLKNNEWLEEYFKNVS